MDERLRILRVVIVSAVILLAVKGFEFWYGLDAAFVGVGPAVASSPAPAHDSADETADVIHDEPDDALETGDGHDAAPAPVGASGQGQAVATTTPATQSNSAAVDRGGNNLTRAEIEVLETLRDRRKELDVRSRELDLKQKLLVASEQRLDERIAELKAIEERIQGLLVQRDEAAEAQLASLVKVYETMKPKDAARIFEQLEMEVLLPVAGRMKEQKVSAVLAQMESAAAKRLTVNLAKRFGLPDADGTL